jgi:beta-lactamase regulating signal transducer with metallopeptidase domain
MSGTDGVLDTIATGALPVALETLWKVSLVLLFGSVLTWLLRRRSAALRHMIWTFTVCGALIVPVAALIAPSWRVRLLPALEAPAIQTAESSAKRSETSAANTSATTREPQLDRGQTTAARTQIAADTSKSVNLSWPMALLAVWMLGAIAVYSWVVSRLIAVGLLARKSRLITDESWLNALEAARGRLGIRRPVRLLELPGNTTPMTFGLLSSTIVLPEDARSWSPARQRIVLLHELAHVRRRDVLVQLLGQVACAAYWFHPLVWYAARQLRIEREHACDDTVVSAGERPSEYASHLLAVARAYRATPALQPAALAMARPSQLEGRLIAVLAPGMRRAQLTGRRVLLSACIAIGIILPLSALTPVSRAVTNVVEQQSAEVISYSRPTDPLAQRWSWAFAETARRTPRRGYWVGYSITRQSYANNGVISGSGFDLSQLSRRPLQTQLFGTQPAEYRGRGRGPLITRDIAILFRFDGRARTIDDASGVRVHSMHLGTDLEGLPVYWLGHATDAQSISWLTDQFYVLPTSQYRDEVIDAVGVHQTASLAVPFLSRVLAEESDPELRAEAAEGLGEQGSPDAERLLREVVQKDPSLGVRREGAEALGAFTTPTATAALLELAHKADDSDVRTQATEALGEQSTPEALRALEDLVFNADDLDVMREAAESIGDMTDDMGFAVLYKVLRSHPRWEIRAEAAESMAEIDPAQSISALEEAIFRDRDQRVQEDAVEAAGDLGERAHPLLRRVIRDHPDPEVRSKARETLDESPRRSMRDRLNSLSGSPSPSPSLYRYRRHHRPHLRHRASSTKDLRGTSWCRSTSMNRS